MSLLWGIPADVPPPGTLHDVPPPGTLRDVLPLGTLRDVPLLGTLRDVPPPVTLRGCPSCGESLLMSLHRGPSAMSLHWGPSVMSLQWGPSVDVPPVGSLRDVPPLGTLRQRLCPEAPPRMPAQWGRSAHAASPPAFPHPAHPLPPAASQPQVLGLQSPDLSVLCTC